MIILIANNIINVKLVDYIETNQALLCVWNHSLVYCSDVSFHPLDLVLAALVVYPEVLIWI